MERFEKPNPFIKSVEDYSRDLNIIDASLNDNAKYLQLMTGKPFEMCLDFTKQNFRKGGKFELINPEVSILDRNPYGDRELKKITFMGFLNRVEKQRLGLAPSLTAYLPPDVRKSTHALYIAEGVANRKRVKKEQLKAEQEAAALRVNGNTKEADEKEELAQNKKGEQENFKINNNAYSGGTVSQATILYNKSTHSSLTSTCRTATSYANANNEKFITGNRHYYNPEITKANLVSIINLSDLNKIEDAVNKFNLVYPTPENVVDMVSYSSNHYWHNKEYMNQIYQLAVGMTPVERAAVVYVGDLYHLHKYNKDTIRKFLLQLSSVGRPDQEISEEEYQTYDGDMDLLANFICFDTVKGRSKDSLRKEAPEVLKQIYATGRNIAETLNEYKVFIDAFFLTKCVPSSVHAFHSSYRRAAIVSDTDSTMFTMQNWVEEFYGKVVFTPEAKRLVFSLVFLVSEVVMHILAIQSANMGVAKDKLRLLAMKNEYYFALLALTTRSKHYFASKDALEGVMFNDPRMEIKGVGLRDSKVVKKINDRAKRMMKRILETVKKEEMVDVHSLLTEIADLEREIISSVLNGKAEYLTTGQTKHVDSYKSDKNATHQKGLIWKELFAPFYGEAGDPPYTHVKLSVNLKNKTAINNWIEGIENKDLAYKIKAWVERENKKSIGNFHIPSSVVEAGRIPDEITRIANIRTIISNTMGAFYLIMEVFGIFLLSKGNHRLISDFY